MSSFSFELIVWNTSYSNYDNDQHIHIYIIPISLPIFIFGSSFHKHHPKYIITIPTPTIPNTKIKISINSIPQIPTSIPIHKSKLHHSTPSQQSTISEPIEYIEKPFLSNHILSLADLPDLPSESKIIRDQIRCMHSLGCNERWSGKYLVRDSVQGQCEPGFQIGRFEAGCNTGFEWENVNANANGGDGSGMGLGRELMEFVVAPSGLVCRVNAKYAGV
ncbi:unnamed protein product [Ambrosiozyma monospora]|uniref:Unnamed protein product n=1 Tax=Ambrosiozyma monospora TaxID=43982 RepID=A0ACB5SX82_AMBMO|nr:unnamed protein product [Ambrosiozyma monospora]